MVASNPRLQNHGCEKICVEGLSLRLEIWSQRASVGSLSSVANCLWSGTVAGRSNSPTTVLIHIFRQRLLVYLPLSENWYYLSVCVCVYDVCVCGCVCVCVCVCVCGCVCV